MPFDSSNYQPNDEVLAILTVARSKIDAGWCRWPFAVDARGKSLHGVFSTNGLSYPGAIRFCAQGALVRASFENSETTYTGLQSEARSTSKLHKFEAHGGRNRPIACLPGTASSLLVFQAARAGGIRPCNSREDCGIEWRADRSAKGQEHKMMTYSEKLESITADYQRRNNTMSRAYALMELRRALNELSNEILQEQQKLREEMPT